MKEVVVSIIIPLYNREVLIIETLESIVAQSFEQWECIIVDDHSEDKSFEVVQAYAKEDQRIQVFKRPDHLKKGANSCRNYGFSKSKGKYIQWFDSDDLMLPQMLASKIKGFQNEYDFVATRFSLFKKENSITTTPNFSIKRGLIADYLCGDIPINTPMVLWKRDIVVQEKFNEVLTRAQELDFISRIFIKKEPKGIVLSDTLVKIREHGESITGNYNRGGKNETSDEIKIRYNIHNTYKDYKEATLYMYYKAVKNGLQKKYYWMCVAHLSKTLFSIKKRFIPIHVKLVFLTLSLAIFGKGLEKYKSIIKKYE